MSIEVALCSTLQGFIKTQEHQVNNTNKILECGMLTLKL
jgi:hypothetical protein